MKLTDNQKEEMFEAAKPLIKWINENVNPHTEIVVTATSVELMQPVEIRRTFEFVKD